MDSYRKSIVNVGFVQIVFGLLCVCLQIPLLLVPDSWHSIGAHGIFTLAIASFATIAGVCVFLPDRHQPFIRRTKLYVASSTCAAGFCLLYLTFSFGGFVDQIRQQSHLSIANDVPVEGSPDQSFWLLAFLFLSILVVLFFSMAGIAITMTSPCLRQFTKEDSEDLKIFTESSGSC